MKRSPLKRKTPMRSKVRVRVFRADGTGGDLTRKPRKPMKQLGKSGHAWQAARQKLKAAFQRAGITVCELQGPGCWRDNGLGFAHSKKRRNIKGERELFEVVLACNVCHDAIERLPESDMGETVRLTICQRSTTIQP